jgi:hypothetical protein
LNLSEVTKQLIVALLAAHLLGDFVLQSDEDVGKKYKIYIRIKHSVVLAGLSYLLVGLWSNWVIPLTIFVTHLMIDSVKTKLSATGLKGFVFDQLAHVGTIVAIAFILVWWDASSPSTYWETQVGNVYYVSLVLLSGIIVTVSIGSIVIELGVRPFQDQLALSQSKTSDHRGETDGYGIRGFIDGGKIIGQLERALIFLLVLVDQPAGIGFLIAAKSIFRFGEIKERSSRMEAEYIIIGTLMSFLFGLSAAYLTGKAMALF